MNKDQVKGRIKQAEGKGEEAVGKITGNKRMKNKGKVKKSAGKLRARYGDLKDDLNEGK